MELEFIFKTNICLIPSLQSKRKYFSSFKARKKDRKSHENQIKEH